MSIYAQDIEKAVGFLPGLFKFDPEEPFCQAVLTLSKKEIMIYSDNGPDEIKGEDWQYNVKVRVPFEDIELVTNEVIKSKRKMSEDTNRIIIKVKDKEQAPISFFYYKAKEKLALNIMAGFKRFKIKYKTIKTKLTY